MVERAFDALVVPGDVTELRWITRHRTFGVAAGYFNDREKFVTAALTDDMAVEAPATNMLLNPGRPELLARIFNRIQWRVQNATTDKDILVRRRILGDCDARRPVAEISATDSEHGYAIDRMFMMAEQLRSDHGWGAPIQADSGNGGHNIWPIHEPNDAATTQLIKRVHQALDKRFSDERVEIDPTVFNAARLTKTYGTPARKGDDVPDRPHRLSALLSVPEFTEIVTREQLEEVARSGEPRVQVNGAGPGERGQSKGPAGDPGADEAGNAGEKKKKKKASASISKPSSRTISQKQRVRRKQPKEGDAGNCGSVHSTLRTPTARRPFTKRRTAPWVFTAFMLPARGTAGKSCGPCTGTTKKKPTVRKRISRKRLRNGKPLRGLGP
jgi:hypothetical protein